MPVHTLPYATIPMRMGRFFHTSATVSIRYGQ